MPDSPTGLMAFWASITPSYLSSYQQWHNCEHMPERLSIPGFISGHRYRSLTNQPDFLMYYETQDSSICASEAYMAALNAPTPWTREALTHFEKPVRSIYSCIGVAESKHLQQNRKRERRLALSAPYISTIRFDLPSANEGAYIETFLPAACEAENVRRIRFYRVDTAVGNISTSERKIYSGGPGKQEFLLMIEYSLPPAREEGKGYAEVLKRGDEALGAGMCEEGGRVDEEGWAGWLEMAYSAQEGGGGVGAHL